MKRIFNYIYFFIPVLFIIVSGYCIFNNYIHGDEGYSLFVIQKEFYEMIRELSLDVHPPMYYIMLKNFIGLTNLFTNNYIIAAKFFSFLPIIILVFAGFTLVKDLYGKKTAFLFNIFVISMPEMLIYAVEIRMYSWAMMFVTVAFLYMVKVIRYNRNKDYVFLSIFTILAINTHFYSTITMVIIYFIVLIYFLYKKIEISKFIISSICVSASFIPWMLIQFERLFKETTIRIGWIKEITFKDIVGFMKFPFSVMKYNFVSYILLGITIYVTYILLKSLHKKINNLNVESIFSISIIVILTLIGIIVSYVYMPVFARRFMFPTFGLFWLSIAITATHFIQNKKIMYTIIIAYFLSGIIVNVERIQFEKKYSNEFIKINNVLNSIDEDCYIIADNTNVSFTLMIYLPKNNIIFDECNDPKNVIEKYTKDGKKTIVFIKEKKLDEKTKFNVVGSFYLDNAGDMLILQH